MEIIFIGFLYVRCTPENRMRRPPGAAREIGHRREGGGEKGAKKRERKIPVPLFQLQFGFNGLMVVGVGAGRGASQDLCLGYLANEQLVAAQIHGLLHLTGEHGIAVLRQVNKTIVTPLEAYKVRELIHIPAGLHAEVPNCLEGHILRQDADVEFAGFLDDLLGQILLLTGDGNPQGIGCHLDAGIDDAAVILLLRGGEYEQTVA